MAELTGPAPSGPAATGPPVARAQAARPEAARPEAARPEAARPEAARPEAAAGRSLPLAIAVVADIPPPTDPIWREWLTPAELAYCGSLQHVLDHLAVRVLAKRVTARALAWPGEIPWQEVEILRRPAGGPAVELGDLLGRWRRERGLPVPGVSLTHAAGHAAALAWLPGRPSPPA